MIPKLVKIRQEVPAPEIKDISSEVIKEIEALNLNKANFQGKRIGITVGSRGIQNISVIIRTIVGKVREYGGDPVAIASMGSHGGGTTEGQAEMLESLNITESSVECPILCNIEAVQVGETQSGIPVFCNSEAVKLDGIIVCNRIKSHTDFSGTIESGLCKMMTIGLGNHKGASTAHYYAVNNGYTEMICESAEVIMKNLPILFGIGIVENWKNKTMIIKGTIPESMIDDEKDLLKKYKDSCLKLPFQKADVLIVGELGKNISGAGMDTKVIGRIKILGQEEPENPQITNIAVLGLTEESHGNATGIGLADYTTMNVYNKIDLNATTINGLTSMSPDQIKLPVVLENDESAIDWACKTLGPSKENDIKIAFIQNTAMLEELSVSENMLGDLNGKIKVIGDSRELAFDKNGTLISPLQ